MSAHVVSARELLDDLRRKAAGQKLHPNPDLDPDLGLIVAGANPAAVASVRPAVAGYGSEVTLEDPESGQMETYRLMHADAMDLDRGHVSLESPLGAQLLGVGAGQIVTLVLPGGRRMRRVASVSTLFDLAARGWAPDEVATGRSGEPGT